MLLIEHRSIQFSKSSLEWIVQIQISMLAMTRQRVAAVLLPMAIVELLLAIVIAVQLLIMGIVLHQVQVRQQNLKVLLHLDNQPQLSLLK